MNQLKELLAAAMFFTRLPFWRLASVSPAHFRRVVIYWPLMGWLTGSVMALLFFIAYTYCSPVVAVAIALLGRMVLTGALHEDGLADFFDGIGAGGTPARILAIMKDSHIGTYGVLALVGYILLWVAAVTSITLHVGESTALVLIAGDCWAKGCASQVTNLLPYVRTQEEAKIKQCYEVMSWRALLFNILFAVIPLVLCAVSFFGRVWRLQFFTAAIAPIVVLCLLLWLMKRRIGGYSGDCCGAVFLLCELSFFIFFDCLWSLF